MGNRINLMKIINKHVLSLVTYVKAGLMSAQDKQHLDRIVESNVRTDSNTKGLLAKDDFHLIADKDSVRTVLNEHNTILFSGNTVSKTLDIFDVDTTFNIGTHKLAQPCTDEESTTPSYNTGNDGFMSAQDKYKLDHLQGREMFDVFYSMYDNVAYHREHGAYPLDGSDDGSGSIIHFYDLTTHEQDMDTGEWKHTKFYDFCMTIINNKSQDEKANYPFPTCTMVAWNEEYELNGSCGYFGCAAGDTVQVGNVSETIYTVRLPVINTVLNSGNVLGKYEKGKIPNIGGQFTSQSLMSQNSFSPTTPNLWIATGVFSNSSNYKGITGGAAGAANVNGLVDFDASKGSIITKYIKTTDTVIDTNKTYYTYNSTTDMYTKVDNPVSSNISTYYEGAIDYIASEDSVYGSDVNAIIPQSTGARLYIQVFKCAIPTGRSAVNNFLKMVLDSLKTRGLLSSAAKSMFEVFWSASSAAPYGAFKLDGQVIDCSVEHKKFYDECVARRKNGTIVTCTDAEFENELATYGSCAKFVIDAENTTGKIRIPSINNYLLNTVLGSQIEAGLPNITGRFNDVYSTVSYTDGAFKEEGSYSAAYASSHGSSSNYVVFDASRGAITKYIKTTDTTLKAKTYYTYDKTTDTYTKVNNPVDTSLSSYYEEYSPYGKSDTVQPPSSGLCLYIQVDLEEAKQFIPVGFVMACAYNVTKDQLDKLAKDGWLECNGAATDKTLYRALYKVIGDIYGNSGDPGTFLLPDYRGRFLKGTDSDILYEEAGLPNIVGTVGGYNGWADGVLFKGTSTAGRDLGTGATDMRQYSFDAGRYNDIYGKSNTVTPKNCSVRYFIKF